MLKMFSQNVLLFLLAYIFMLSGTSFAEISTAFPSTDQDLIDLNIKDLTIKQDLLYGRELYRKGDYGEAVTVFQNILKHDCLNHLAQYHLQKISRQSPEFAYLDSYLKQLPCEQYNINNEAFLPASLYYETDNDLLVEQLEACNKKYHNDRVALTAKIAEYKTAAEQLEQRTREMAETSSTNDAQFMTDEVTALKKAPEQAALERNRVFNNKKSGLTTQEKEIEYHKDNVIATLKEQLADVKSESSETITRSITPANAEELNTLQSKLSSIQQRLEQINTAIAEKNQRLLELKETVETLNPTETP